MTEKIEQQKREDIPENLTWDLTTIFATDEKWEEAYKQVQEQTKEFAKYNHAIESAAGLLEVIEKLFELVRKAESVFVYAHLKFDQDTNNQFYAAYAARTSSLSAELMSVISFVEPEILNIDAKQIEEFFTQEPRLQEYKFWIEQILESKSHILPVEQESLLSGASDIFSASSKTFGVINNADLDFGTVAKDGNDIELTHGNYSTFIESPDRQVRKEAFETLYKSYKQFKNTFASTLASNVNGHNYMAKVHHFDSAKQAALFSNHIPSDVYDQLVSSVNEHLPLLHRFVSLRKKILKLQDLQPYDLYTPLGGEVDLNIDYETAKSMALEALAPLGEKYLEGVNRAFDERWIDVLENSGKRSGAYSSGVYDTNPYILLNWQDTLDNLYTLVHEMGHSMHSLLTIENQPIQYGDYPIFLAEIASTTNEGLLTYYLLDKYKQPEIQQYILNQYLDGFKGTVFRQTQFAEFEDWIHQEAQSGNALTAEVLKNKYAELNAHYYGQDLDVNEDISYEWARIPHFYYNYYVYQYATGEAAATTLAKGMVENPEKNVPLYLEYLKSGSSANPIDIMKKAGVDMESDKYLNDAFSVFEQRLDQLEQLITKQ